MKTYLHLSKTFDENLPSEFRDDDVRFPESLVTFFLEEYTRAGDVVLDPFAGYGTTLRVAERMGRVPLGIEINAQKANYIRTQLQNPTSLIHGDARRLGELGLPRIDFSITSPPYMSLGDLEDPLTDYTKRSRGYAAYLQDIRGIYGQMRNLMQPAGVVVIEAANLKINGQLTTLAWNLAEEVSKVLHFEGEVVICWDQYGYGYDHSYCLVFSVL